ncbi:MAG: SprT-like family protein [Thermodesulfobacteriota bacterium]
MLLSASVPASPGELAARLEGPGFAPEEIRRRAEGIRTALAQRSGRLGEGNFRALAVGDLGLLFAEYDQAFFGGALTRTLGAASDPARRLRFRLAPRMTRAGGKTFQFRPARPGGPPSYEIAVSTHLLFSNFHAGHRRVEVNGLRCRDRLDALQRIFEHELVHLAELLAYGKSSCRASGFRELARRLFGHTEATHGLVTPSERARDLHGLRVGDRVAFPFHGRRTAGVLNRVTKRATVLVEDPRGAPYSDGKRYRKYYVPLPALERAK